MYFDLRSQRVGGEKDTESEADTVGCCSLRAEHLELRRNNRVFFSFLGKDSIRYENEVTVSDQVYQNLERLLEGQADDAQLFPLLNVAGDPLCFRLSCCRSPLYLCGV